jgi:tetratricopeptide (TPR) repeat protein
VDQEDEEVLYYLQNLGFAEMNIEQLVAAGLSWREEGQELRSRGELSNAMLPFQKSRAAFIELHQRESGGKRALFELGQAEFWVGYTYYDEGELDEAEESFTRYGAITRRLVNAEPNNAEWAMELSYTLINLSALERQRPGPDPEKTLELSQAALQYNQIALVLEPENAQYRQELATTMAYLADAWLDSCDLGRAFELRTQSVELSRILHEEDKADEVRQLEYAYSLSGLAAVQRQVSLSAQALESLGESQDLLVRLYQDDDASRSTYWQARLRAQRSAWIMAEAGEAEQALTIFRSVVQEARADFIDSIDSDFRTATDYSELLINYAVLAHRMGLNDEADLALREAANRLTNMVTEKPGHSPSRLQLARVSFENWVQNGALPSEDVDYLLEGFLSDPAKVTSCNDASMAARLAVMHEDKELAKDYTSYLLGKGFYEADFVRFCNTHEVCD